MPKLWIGIDVGGTFTDVVGIDVQSARYWVTKVPSSSSDPAGAVVAGISDLLSLSESAPNQVDRIVYGTTVALNVLLEHKGARVAMVTTRGFRDVIEIGRMLREELYDIMFEKAKPLVPRYRRFEVSERIDSQGAVMRPLHGEEARQVLDQIGASDPEALAVCFLHAYANPAHEREMLDLVRDRYVELPMSLSSDVSPEYSEYERFSTTVLNSYLMPRTRAALGSVSDRVGALGIQAPVEVMQSNGGVTTVEIASDLPVRLLGSGPAGGVAGATALAAAIGVSNLITLDIGGTSTDVCLVANGVPAYTTQRQFDGQPVRTVMTDVQSIGTGGGSIARVDVAGSLHVGPESAGAEPGPISYGQGGREVTVTDADVVLGYLNPDRFLAGRRRLEVEAAAEAVREQIASPTGTDAVSAALGVVSVAVNNMVGSLRKVTTQQGHDPRDFTLVAFGGAGPVHAGLVAREAGIQRVMVPAYPGLLSAMGLLLSDNRTETSVTFPRTLDSVSPEELTSIFDDLEQQARTVLAGQHTTGNSLHAKRLAEMCYQGQRHELPVDIPPGTLTAADLEQVARQLDERFMELYGFLPVNHIPQLVHLRVFLEKRIEEGERLRQSRVAGSNVSPHPAVGQRRLYFRGVEETGEMCPVYDRLQLALGSRVEGPCVVEEDYSTTVVYPGQSLEVDGLGNLILTTYRDERG